MEEPIFNLFAYVSSGTVMEIGATKHIQSGTDKEKAEFLKSKVADDHSKAIRFPVPSAYLRSQSDSNLPSLKYETLRSMMVIGQHIDMFENLFQAMGASLSPLYCITPIVDGEPLVEVIEYKNFLEAHRPTRIESHQIAPSYLTSYMTPDGFDFPKLFNDDFFLAIRLSYNHRHYISCMKLLVSFIDTVAFLEFGDVQRNFQTFLEKYADLQHLTITSDELWEFRNSLLHMTNNESRKVKKGSTRKLLFYVGELPKSFPMEIDGIGYFGLMDLIKTFAKAVEAWITDLNNDRSKYPLLFDRYDSILSDVRFDMLKFESLPIQA